MLSTSNPVKAGSSGEYYREMARGEYYTGNGQEPGQWFGPGAKALGLLGKVEEPVLSNLMDGRSPDGSRNLVQNAGHPNRQMGWDHTFSAPKPVSVLWASAPELREVIEQAHTDAVRTALSYLNDRAGLSRRGQGGRTMEKASLVCATFLETLSRELDPQIHTHALVLNVGVRADGTTGALWSHELFVEKMAAGAIYRAQLAADLSRDLRLAIQARRVGFDLVGVPTALCRDNSKRRQAIEATLAEWNDHSAVAAKAATLATRPAKQKLPQTEVEVRWRTIEQKHGWTAQKARALVDRSSPRQASAEELAAAVATEAQLLPTDRRNRKHVVRLAGRLAIELNADGAALRSFYEAKVPELLRWLNTKPRAHFQSNADRPRQTKRPPDAGELPNQTAHRSDQKPAVSRFAESQMQDEATRGQEPIQDIESVRPPAKRLSSDTLAQSAAAAPTQAQHPGIPSRPESGHEVERVQTSPRPKRTSADTANEATKDTAGAGTKTAATAGPESEIATDSAAAKPRRDPSAEFHNEDHDLHQAVALDTPLAKSPGLVQANASPSSTAQQSERETPVVKRELPVTEQPRSVVSTPAVAPPPSENTSSRRRIRSVVHSSNRRQDILAELKARFGVEEPDRSVQSKEWRGGAQSPASTPTVAPMRKTEARAATHQPALPHQQEVAPKWSAAWRGTVERSASGTPVVVRTRQAPTRSKMSTRPRVVERTPARERQLKETAKAAGVLKPGMTATWSDKHDGVLVRSEEGLTVVRFKPVAQSKLKGVGRRTPSLGARQKVGFVELVKSPGFFDQAEAAHRADCRQASQELSKAVSKDGPLRRQEQGETIKRFRAAFQDRLEQMHPENRTSVRAERLAFWLGRRSGLDADLIQSAIGDLMPKNGWSLYRVERYRPFRKSPLRLLRQIRVPRLALRNPPRYWGRVRWRMDLLVCELRVQEKFMAPHSPTWSPVHSWRLPVLRLTTEKARLPRKQPSQKAEAARAPSQQKAPQQPIEQHQDRRPTMEHGY